MKVPVDYQLLVVNAATVLESTFMCWYALVENVDRFYKMMIQQGSCTR